MTSPEKNPSDFQLPEPSDEELKRIGRLLGRIGGANVNWGAEDFLNVWAIEQRARLDQMMSARINRSSWALFFATVALVICTAALIWATLAA